MSGDLPPLHDYRNSRAVLIGTWDYRWLPPVRAAANSFERMVKLLTGPLCGWPEECLVTVRNQVGPGMLPDRLVTVCEEAEDIILFYYVGHGQIDPDEKLCLGLRESRQEPERRATTSLTYDDVRKALRSSPAKTKIVILDCCFAGLANLPANTLNASATPVEQILDRTTGTGAYVMGATMGYATAGYEDAPGIAEPETYFTKYLIDLVESGLPGQPAKLTLRPLFLQLKNKLILDGRPSPGDRNVDQGSDFVFAHNAAPAETQRDPEREIQGLREQLNEYRQEIDDLTERLSREDDADNREELQVAVEEAERKASAIPKVEAAIEDVLRDAEQASDAAGRAKPADAGAAPEGDAPTTDVSDDPDLRQRIEIFSTEQAIGELLASPPEFADERYSRLVQAVLNAKNAGAALKLADIFRQHRHLYGEVFWLATAVRLDDSNPETAFRLAEIYRWAGLDEKARELVASAALHGHDDAVSEFLSWPDRVRDQVARKFPGIGSATDMLWRAAKDGSIAATRELGVAAFKANRFKEAVPYLRHHTLSTDPDIMYMLGMSLLSLGRRRAGRAWLRKAGKHGIFNAKLQFAMSSWSNRPLNTLAGQAIVDIDSSTPDVITQAGKLLTLADYCTRRQLTETALRCLERAAVLGSTNAKVRLGTHYFDRGRLGKASQWLTCAGWEARIPDDAARELVFQLGCGLHWAGDTETGERWLKHAADAGHGPASEIVAKMRRIPFTRRRRRRVTLPPGLRRAARLAGIVARFSLSRYGLWVAGTVLGLAGIGVAGSGVWLFFEQFTKVFHEKANNFVGILFQLAAVCIFMIGVYMVAGSFMTYREAIDSRSLHKSYRR